MPLAGCIAARLITRETVQPARSRNRSNRSNRKEQVMTATLERYQLILMVGPGEGLGEQGQERMLEANRALYPTPNDVDVAAAIGYLSQFDAGKPEQPHRMYKTMPVFQGELFELQGKYLLCWRGRRVSLWRVWHRCATAGCEAIAVERITSRHRSRRHSQEPVQDDVCTPCADSYAARLSLAVTREPLV